MSTVLKTTRRQRPSRDLATLSSQLRQALRELQSDDDGPGARDYRRFVRRAMAQAWRAAITGETGVMAEVIEIFREARPMVDDALPLLEPRAGAAVEMQQMLAVLYLGEGELRKVKLENRLTDRGRHPTERGVLEVMVTAERALRQKEVYERMPASARPSPARVGQILRELFRDRYLQKQLGRARGRSEVAHYHLSPRGRDLCSALGISDSVRIWKPVSSEIPALIQQAMDHAVDATKPLMERRIAAGMIANLTEDQYRLVLPALETLSEPDSHLDQVGMMLVNVIAATRELHDGRALVDSILNSQNPFGKKSAIRAVIEQSLEPESTVVLVNNKMFDRKLRDLPPRVAATLYRIARDSSQRRQSVFGCSVKPSIYGLALHDNRRVRYVAGITKPRVSPGEIEAFGKRIGPLYSLSHRLQRRNLASNIVQ